MEQAVVDATGDCLVGRGRADLAEAATRDGSDRSSELVERLASIAPVPGSRVVLTTSGDAAAALAHALAGDDPTLVVVDERVTGLGRTGRWFASSDDQPDVVILGEGLTSGYAPMGALLISPHSTVEVPSQPAAGASAVALANLDIIEREGLAARAADQQVTLAAALTTVRTHSLVVSVLTGPGLMAVVSVKPAIVDQLTSELRARGVLCRAVEESSLVVAPALTIDRAGLQSLGAVIDDALSAVGSRRQPSASANVTLLPDITGDEAGGFGSRDAELLRDVPPHHGS